MLLKPLRRILRGRQDVVIRDGRWSRDDEQKPSDVPHDVAVVEELPSLLAQGEVVESCSQDWELLEVGVDAHPVAVGEGLQCGAAVERGFVDFGIRWHVD